MPSIPRKRVVVLLILICIASAGIVVASISSTPISNNNDGQALTGSSGVQGTLTGDFDIYTNSGGVDWDTIQFNTSAGNVSFSASGPASATIDKTDIGGSAWTNLSALDVTSNELQIDPGDKHPVSVQGSVTQLRYRQESDTAVGDGQPDFVYSADGSGSVTINSLPANTEVAAWSPPTGSLGTFTTDSSGQGTISVETASNAQVHLFVSEAPSIDENSASPTGGVIEEDQTYSINVSDADFGTQSDDEITATLYVDGSSVGSDTLTSNGTASVTHTISEGGAHSYSWEVSDTYSHTTTSGTFSMSVPSTLYIYNESAPDQLIDQDTNIRIRLFGQDDETVIEQEITDGTVDMGTLPADQRYVITLASEGTSDTASDEPYYYRRVILDSIYEQQSVYLLPKSQSSVEVEFSFRDFTGNYPPSDTYFYIEKSIQKDFDEDGEEDTQYQAVAGDTIGPTASFPATLQENERYRLRIKNTPNQRLLGSFTATRDEVEQITIRGQTLEPPEDQNYGVLREISRTDSGQRQLTFKYTDPSESTSHLDVNLRYRANETTVWQDQASDVKNYSVYDIPLANDTSYVLAWNATIDGETVGSRMPIGGGSVNLNIPLDPDWLGSTVLVGVVFVAALGGVRKTTYIAMSVVAVAGVAMYLGVVDILVPLWWLAALIAAGGHLRVMQSPQNL